MAITIEVKPDLSAFREARVAEIVEAIECSQVTAQALLEKFWVVPR